MVALPQTLALFSGQHNWYDTGGNNPADPTKIPCKKCHPDVQSELDQPGYPNTMHRGMDCKGCHIITAPAKRGLVYGGPIASDFHAAAAPMCLDCHGGSGPGGDARSIVSGPEEVHKPFIREANTTQNSMLKGANEACIGCHTHVAVDINWTKAYMMSFNVTEFVSTNATGITTHDWNVGNFSVKGKAQIQTYGNQTGGIYTGTNPQISIDPLPLGFNPANP